MLRTMGGKNPFSNRARVPAARKRRGRSFLPEVVGLESRVVPSTFTKPTSTDPFFRTSFEFTSDINATIKGYGDIRSTTDPQGFSTVLTSDSYKINVNPSWHNDFSVSFSIDGLSTNFPKNTLIPADQFTKIQVGFTVFNPSTFGSLYYTDSRAINTSDSSYVFQFNRTNIDFLEYSPVSSIYIVVFINGLYRGPIDTPSYMVAVTGNTTPPPTLPTLAIQSAAITPDSQNVNATYTIAGSDLLSPGTIDFYWATGPNFSDRVGSPKVVTTDTKVGAHTASTSITSLGQRPANATHIIAVANSLSADPAHNVASVAAPLPDIAMVSASISGSVVNYFYNSINNPGLFTVALYQSGDQTFDASDKFLAGQTVVPPLALIGQGSFNLSPFSPDPTRPYLLVVADPPPDVSHPNGQIVESNENNNRAVVQWLPSDVAIVSATYRNSVAKYLYRTLNDPGSFTVSLYTSADPKFDDSDALVGAQKVTHAPNSSGAGSFVLNFTPNPAYPYLLVVAKADNQIGDTNQGNNVSVAWLVALDELRAIMPNLSRSDAERYLDPLNRALSEFEINTSNRISAFLSQVAYESGELRTWIEAPTDSPPIDSKVNADGRLLRSGQTQAGVVIESQVTYYVFRRTDAKGVPLLDAKGQYIERRISVTGPNFERYDNRTDLGNTGSPDGRNFRGRGPIQITGRDIYTRAGNYLGFDLINNYEWVSDNVNRPDVGFRTTAYWWSVFKRTITRNGKNLTDWADSVDPSNADSVKTASDMITRIVKGLNVNQVDGTFLLRSSYFRRALRILRA